MTAGTQLQHVWRDPLQVQAPYAMDSSQTYPHDRRNLIAVQIPLAQTGPPSALFKAELEVYDGASETCAQIMARSGILQSTIRRAKVKIDRPGESLAVRAEEIQRVILLDSILHL